MDRRRFLTLFATTLAGCTYWKAYWRVDPYSVFIRSDLIDSPEKEAEIISMARLEKTSDGRITVLHTQGTPYEIGFQHGYLLRKQIQDNIAVLYDNAVDKFKVEELFDESYERMRPYIPPEYVEEMHGLAHGSKLPLRVIHGIHALPEIGEWGGKKKIKNIVKRMIDGELGTSCSNLCATGDATTDGKMYVTRILDWGLHRISNLHKYPLIHVCKPTGAIPFVNIGWIGFIGAISGMNAQKITLGEMGYGDVEGETLAGKPMPFLLRDVLAKAKNLKDVRNIIETSAPTNSFIFLMSDGKSKEGEMYVRDPNRFVAVKAGSELNDRGHTVPPINDIVYGGHYLDKMVEVLNKEKGNISPERLMKEIIPFLVMPSNFQNVVYNPEDLTFWVANAASKDEPAAQQPYTFFDFGEALRG